MRKRGLSLGDLVALAFFNMVMGLGISLAYADDTPTDSARIAAALVSDPIDNYSGNFWFTRVNTDGQESPVNGCFNLSKSGKVTGLWLSDQSGDLIPIMGPSDKPLDGLPVNIEGTCRDYYLQVFGYDRKGQQLIATGYFETKVLKPSDAIVVILTPAMKEHFVPFSAPGEVEVSDLIAEIEGNGYVFYDQSRQGFDLWLDPSRDQEITVRDNRTGIIYWRGLASEFGQKPTEQVVNLKLAGGVIDLFPGAKTWVDHQGEILDGQVVSQDGNTDPVKVYLANLAGDGASFYFWQVSGQGTMEIYSIGNDGERSLVQVSELVGTSSGQYSINLWPGYDKIIVVIKGDINSFSFGASRYSGSGKG
mgnify:CR=1 FL=1